jgi:hypothetical protein
MAASTTSLNVPVTANTVDFQKGMADAQKYLTNFVTQAKAVGPATSGFSSNLQKMGLASKGFQTNIKNSAFQIQDFAVQLASGTSATRAMAQQLPQLLSGFGLFGALAGTAAAILVPLAANFFTAGRSAKTFEQSMKDLKGAASEYLGSLRDVKDALSDPAWSNTAFGKMMIDANKVLEQVNLLKFREELNKTAQSIATEFGQIQGSIKTTNDVVAGIDAKLLKGVSGLKEIRNQYRGAAADIKGFYISVSSSGDVFLNLVKGLRNYGVEANKAATLTKAFMDAIKSGDPKAVAVAVDALNKQIELTGIAAGKSTEEIAQQQAQLAALAAQMGGVISTAASLQSAWATLGAQAVTTASQISTLVAQMSQLNLVGAASTWETIKTTYSSSGAAGIVSDFTKKFTTDLQTNAKAVQAQRDAVLDSIDPLRALGREKARLSDLQKAGVITMDEYNAAVANLNKTLDGAGGKGGKGGGGGAADKIKKVGDAVKGAGKAMADAKKPIDDFAKGLQEVVQSAAQGVFDALWSIAEGSKSAKEAFTELAKSMLKQIAQLIFQLLVLKPLMSMFPGGGAVGGLLGGGAGLLGRSAGGVARTLGTAPRIAPGAPVMRSATIGTYGSGAPSANTSPVNVVVNNNSSSATVKQTQRGNDIYLEVIDIVSEAIVRGGTPLDKALNRAYGSRRVGY